MKPYCNNCGGQHEQTTATCGVWSAPILGFSYRIPSPETVLMKKMPCSHYGILLDNKWVCQTCVSWELAKLET